MPPDSFESGLFVLVDGTGREPGQAKAGYHHEGDILPFDILNKAWYTRLSSTNRNLKETPIASPIAYTVLMLLTSRITIILLGAMLLFRDIRMDSIKISLRCLLIMKNEI